MKKLLLIALTISLTSTGFAKKVKFAVDMTGTPLNVTGLHVSGDFQTLAGFPGGDWASNTTPLTQEGTTDIYSIIVDIPAFAKYEYKFVNGDQFYDAEFVPEQSRVGYNFNDNRWIYVDSIADDTTFVGAILFGGNAPSGLSLVRFFVDMQNQTVSPSGVHVAGNFQGWDPAKTILYSFEPGIYEVISYASNGTYEYKFYNGNMMGTEEVIPGICSVNSNREVQVTGDTLLAMVCFASCAACVTNVSEVSSLNKIQLAPNPANIFSILTINETGVIHTVHLTDLSGRIVKQYNDYSDNELRIEKEDLDAGVYFVNVVSNNGASSTAKLILE